ncbi:radical SAM protein [Ruminococcus sp. AM44-9AT]|nr:radical SAM protein [Ruminococcus sp. AM44-9AT]
MVKMIIYKDEVFGFFEIFNEENGTLFRSDINGVDPVMRSFPELLDVGIMGHCNGGQYCRNAGIDCYQKGFTTYAPHMSYENFMEIVKQAAGKTFQIALGGAGDPNKHPQIEDILKSCRAYRIIPNMTTSGFLITDNEVGLIKQYCGAVAVSWYSRFMDGKESNQETIDAVERLVKSGCTTNIHYVVSKDTINEAITRLEMDSFPKGVNAVIFILYKPVGNGIIEKVLKNTDSRIERFISLATKVKHPYRVGFDTCFTPALLRWGDTVPAVSIDACEAATFSMYIDSQMNCYPCSFGIWDKNISESMNSKTLREIWRGDKFVAFREQRKVKCSSCRQMKICQGGCRLGIDIDMC